MDFLKTITGKVISGLVGLFAVICGISWYRTDPRTRQMLMSGTGRIFAWLGIVLVVPWLAFALIGWVTRRQSNAAGGMLVGALTLLEMLVLGELFGWSIGGTTAWAFVILGGLAAALYNLLACDWIAEKME